MNEIKKQRLVFLGKIFGVIIFLFIIIIIGYFYYTISFKNYCETQDSTETLENIIQNVIWQFEVFQSIGDTTKATPCISKSLLETGFLDEQFFDFSLVSVEFQKIIKQDENTFIVKITEKRQYFRPGISGGSYVYKWTPVWITLKKIDGRWLITNYKDISNNF